MSDANMTLSTIFKSQQVWTVMKRKRVYTSSEFKNLSKYLLDLNQTIYLLYHMSYGDKHLALRELISPN